MRNLDLNQHRDLNDVTREIDTNLSGPIQMIQQFLPHLKTRTNALIVNVSSGLAFVPFPCPPCIARRSLRFTPTRDACACSWAEPALRSSNLRAREWKRHSFVASSPKQ